MTTYQGYAGHCVSCNKRWWISRSIAKSVGRRLHPGDQLRPYKCPIDSRYWHNGHLPGKIVTGAATRDQIYRKERAA